MPITKRGVYHNLKESKYVVSNKDITFFFSSEHTLNKFMSGYQNNRDYMNEKIFKSLDTVLNHDIMFDVSFYTHVEKRGFYVWLKGVSINFKELNHYALRIMLEKESPVWERTERPKVSERFG
jgi:hypothetical protein